MPISVKVKIGVKVDFCMKFKKQQNLIFLHDNLFYSSRQIAFGKMRYGPLRNRIASEHLPYLLHYGTQLNQPRRRPTTSFRLPGGGQVLSGYPPQTGSFNHLKVIYWFP